VYKKNYFIAFAVFILTGCQPTAAPLVETAVPSPTVTITPTSTEQPAASPAVTPTLPLPTLTPSADITDRYEQARRLGRGVNLGNALEAPAEGEWGMVLQEEYFTLIHQAGFDTVRVPIRWSAHAEDEAPYTIDDAFFERVDWVIEQALVNELNVVINMHHYNELFDEPTAHQIRFIEIWKYIAERFKNKPTQLYYELLNEPHNNLTKVRWEKLMSETVTAVRRIDNVHTIIVGGADWGGIKGLLNLALPEGEENLICTFHFYDPMLFTHQGAEWVSEEYGTLGVEWPGPPETEVTPIPEAANVTWVYTWFSQYNAFPYETNPAGPKPIQSTFDWAERQRDRLDCPMWLGEFGAYGKADMQSRINWTTYVREEAESLGIPWAYWEFGAGFGVYDRENDKWNDGLLKALIPD
jgi:endoglucanase